MHYYVAGLAHDGKNKQFYPPNFLGSMFQQLIRKTGSNNSEDKDRLKFKGVGDSWVEIDESGHQKILKII
jgi:hypothetical protein